MGALAEQELRGLVLELGALLDSYSNQVARRNGTTRTQAVQDVLDRATTAVPALKEIVR